MPTNETTFIITATTFGVLQIPTALGLLVWAVNNNHPSLLWIIALIPVQFVVAWLVSRQILKDTSQH